MKIFKSSLGLFTLTFSLLFLTNIIIFFGVYLNKSDVTSQTVLTQRELKLPYRSFKENSGLSLRITYRTLKKDVGDYSYNRSPIWLNEAKLKELGFDTNKHSDAKKSKIAPSKELFLVLEYDGKTYQKSLKLAKEDLEAKEILYITNKMNKSIKRDFENAEKYLEKEQISESRLFAIDAGLDYEELRIKYTDKRKYIIVEALLNFVYRDRITKPYAYIQNLNIQEIHLPYEFKNILKDIEPINRYMYGNKKNSPPKYSVEVKYGSKYEPWISSVDKLKSFR